MNKKKKVKITSEIPYEYFVNRLTHEDDTPAYQAFIPAFPGLVFADSLSELHEAVKFAIDEGIKDCIKVKKPIPNPDSNTMQFSGKFVLRIPPELHCKLYYEAKNSQKSLNAFIREKLAV